jgi:pyrophosphatase PpaX
VESWMEAFRALGLLVDPAVLRPLIGADGHVVARAGALAAGQAIDGAMAERLDHLAGEAFGRLNRSPRPLPGATGLLGALAASRTPHAIATASRAGQVLASVDALGLESRPLIVDGSHVRHAKPAPDLLLLAARRLHADPGECWYVGDSIWDMQAARAGGMTAAGVTTGFATADDLLGAGGDVVMPNLWELSRRIGVRAG